MAQNLVSRIASNNMVRVTISFDEKIFVGFESLVGRKPHVQFLRDKLLPKMFVNRY